MLQFILSIGNPWRGKNGKPALDYFFKDKTLSRNKSFELQITRLSLADSILLLDLDLRWWGHDHAGPSITIEIGRYFFCAKIYDHRHWDYDRNDWMIHDENDDSEYGANK